MNASHVQLHPKMTAEQIAAWCAHHRKIVHISWEVSRGRVLPVVIALEETPEDWIPPFLRRDAP